MSDGVAWVEQGLFFARPFVMVQYTIESVR